MKSQKYIYVIETGQYDSYRVLAAYPTKKKADAAAEVLNGISRYTSHRVGRLMMCDEPPTMVTIHCREYDIDRDGTVIHSDIWSFVESDIDPLDTRYRAHVRWDRHRSGGILVVRGTDEGDVEAFTRDALRQLKDDPQLRAKRSKVWRTTS